MISIIIVTVALFQFTPFDFFGNLKYENLFKMTFHVINCIKTCQREQVNKLSQHFLHAKCRVNNFEQFYFGILRGGVGNWKRAVSVIVFYQGRI